MALRRSTIERKAPRRMRWRVILEKKLSTALSQEAEVGVNLVRIRFPPAVSQANFVRGPLASAEGASNASFRLPQYALAKSSALHPMAGSASLCCCRGLASPATCTVGKGEFDAVLIELSN